MHSTTAPTPTRRYHPALVALHWLLALLLTLALALGTFILKEIPNDAIVIAQSIFQRFYFQ